MLVNAAEVKVVPGCKTERQDAKWLAPLTRERHVEPSFVLDRAHPEILTTLAQRARLTAERASYANRLRKILEE